jgi:hypothetical protein
MFRTNVPLITPPHPYVMRHSTLRGVSCVVAAISQKPALAATAD